MTKNYLAIFLGSSEAMKNWKPDAAAMKDGMAAWQKWAVDNAASIVDHGSPLGKTKMINKDGIADTSNELGAWTIVKACW